MVIKIIGPSDDSFQWPYSNLDLWLQIPARFFSIYINSKRMTFLKTFKEYFKKLDMFASSEMLRYKEQTEYATMTGAVISIGIFMTIIVLVFQTILHTIEKTQITAVQEIFQESLPSDFTVDFSTMQMAFSIDGVNMNDASLSYFDVVLRHQAYTQGSVTSTTELALEPCTAAHFSSSQDTLDKFNLNNGTYWLCVSPGQSATIGGKKVSQSYQEIKAQVLTCGSHYTTKTNCATATQLVDLFEGNGDALYFTSYTVNQIINPQQKTPLTIFMKDNYLVFSDHLSVLMYKELAEYEIVTDNSLLPNADRSYDKGGFLTGQTQTFPRNVGNNWYATISIKKSDSKYSYQRKFLKLDQTLSYIGGLIGVVIAAFYLMSPYTELGYELSLANQLFLTNDNKPVRNRLNFLTYIGYYWWVYTPKCFSKSSYPEYEMYQECSERMQGELDISCLLKRINILETIVCPPSDTLTNKEVQSYTKMRFEDSKNKIERLSAQSDEEENSSRQQSENLEKIEKKDLEKMDGEIIVEEMGKEKSLGSQVFSPASLHRVFVEGDKQAGLEESGKSLIKKWTSKKRRRPQQKTNFLVQQSQPELTFKEPSEDGGNKTVQFQQENLDL